MTLRALLAHRRCDRISGFLIFFLVVFAPWAFGSVRPGAIWTVNVVCYLLGGLWVAKWLLRAGRESPPDRPSCAAGKPLLARLADGLMVALTAGLLGFCFVSALNARAVYQPFEMVFDYRDYIAWLPHSYDRANTWDALTRYVALACFFWSLRDWLAGADAEDTRSERESDRHAGVTLVPRRLKNLVTVAGVNGALIAVEGIVQRVSGTPKPLWLLEMSVNRDALAQFGPFGYRSNAAQFFNLLWPVLLGLWWTLAREARRRFPSRTDPRRHRHHWLLLPVAAMVVGAFFTSSRGGAFVTLGCLALAAFVMFVGVRHRHASVKFGVMLLFGTLLCLGLYFGWDQLGERLSDTRGGLVTREAIYDTARQMAREHPWFGVGPGAFEYVFQLYRSSPDEYWPRQLHNDWLETLVTFGWSGSLMLLLAMFVAVTRWIAPGNPSVDWRFAALTCVSIVGVLVHARFDYPMQVYSVLLLTMMLFSILFSVSRRAS